MIVISNRNTQKLIKGLQYEVVNLWNDGKSSWLNGKVELKGIGRFSVNNFTDKDGNPLPKVKIINKAYGPIERINFDELKQGDILVCKSDKYTTMIKGGLYKIESTHQENSRGNWVVRRVKFVGISRKLIFDDYNFRKLSTEESREMSLKSVLFNENPNIIKTNNLRKIDMVADKNKELIKYLFLSISDPNRHHLSIIDWACQKSGKSMKIEPSDYESLMGSTLKEFLEKID